MRKLKLSALALGAALALGVGAVGVLGAKEALGVSAETATDVLDNAFIEVTGTTYKDWSGKTGTSGTVYAGNSAGGSDAIQLRSKSNSGIVTTSSVGTATSVTVVWNSETAADRTLDIYGKSSAYSAPSELYNNSTQGTKIGSIVNGTSTELVITEDYSYIGLRSNNGAMYLDSITINWTTGDVPPVNNYTVTYNANGGTGTMTDENSPYTEGATVTVLENSFTFEGYTFDSWNTAQDGTGTSYAPDATFAISANTTLYAQWTENGGGDVDTVTDVLDNAFVGVTGSSYSDWSGKVGTSGAVYAGNSAGSNSSIQLRSNNSNSGIITTISGGTVKTVTVVWNSSTASGRKLDVYGSSSAYTAASDLYDSSKSGTNLGTITCGTSTKLTVTGDYEFIGLRSYSGAMYLTSVSIEWSTGAPKVLESISIEGDLEKTVYTVGETIDKTGLSVMGHYDDGSESPVNATITADPNVLETIGEEIEITFTASYGELNAEAVKKTVKVNDLAYTPISSFYDGTIEVGTTATTDSYWIKGTVIAIESNSYYIQDGEYGLLVYGGSKTPAEGMKVGDLVRVYSKLINYNNYVLETTGMSASPTCEIIGTGTLPTAPVVTTAAEFAAANQSTRITFNGLSVGEGITWSSVWTKGSKNGVATVKDSTGANVTIYISKYLDQVVGEAIVSKLSDDITVDDTFDLFQSVKAVNTNNGEAQLSLSSADQVVIHTPEQDPILGWIDTYMQMDNPDFEGDGTMQCRDQSYYINAKAALKALEEAHEGSIAKFEADEDGDYTAALERYKAWAKACGDDTPFDGAATIVNASSLAYNQNTAETTSVMIVVVAAVALVSIASVVTVVVIKRRRMSR